MAFFYFPEKVYPEPFARVALTDERTVETPMELNVHLHNTDGDPLSNSTRYCHPVGTLRSTYSYPHGYIYIAMYLFVFTLLYKGFSVYFLHLYMYILAYGLI